MLLLLASALPSPGREKKGDAQYGTGLIVNLPLPEAEVAQVVEDVAGNTIIRGTREYNKDEYVKGAVAAIAAPGFQPWKQAGKVFYKVRTQALDPENFKNSGDLGTLSVRYVVQPQGDSNTVLRIDAVFVEEFRKIAHASNGSVESSEYRSIQDHLAAAELLKKETAEALAAKEDRAARKIAASASPADVPGSTPPAPSPTESTSRDSTAGSSASVESKPLPEPSPQEAAAVPAVETVPLQPGESLEDHVARLRREVERVVKKPGAPLQSAPFHTATTLKTLPPGAEILILISTTYWYGVETRDGQHGWVRRDQLESLP